MFVPWEGARPHSRFPPLPPREGGAEVGDEVLLRSLAFQIPSGVDELMTVEVQGAPMDLLRLHVGRRVRERAAIPDRLSLGAVAPDPADSIRERSFKFGIQIEPSTRSMAYHTINGRSFDMSRIDERVTLGETEIWSFSNDKAFAHPVHLHGAHFRVLSRSGGRRQVMPWEGGMKDTVLVYPTETVRVAVRFSAHRGIFPLHCHNIEHEDMGMMLNVLVE
ncbi:MAG: spore coat protein [Gemmatimonadetes bacterium]|nr:spore coat protein [Gemmatimonadota bacterium]